MPPPNRPQSRIGLGHARPIRRNRRILRNNIMGITKPAIRRLARRGGIKRISAEIYDATRDVIKARIETIVRELHQLTRLFDRNTIRVTDVIFVLRRLGTPIYGFDPHTRMNTGLH